MRCRRFKRKLTIYEHLQATQLTRMLYVNITHTYMHRKSPCSTTPGDIEPTKSWAVSENGISGWSWHTNKIPAMSHLFIRQPEMQARTWYMVYIQPLFLLFRLLLHSDFTCFCFAFIFFFLLVCRWRRFWHASFALSFFFSSLFFIFEWLFAVACAKCRHEAKTRQGEVLTRSIIWWHTHTPKPTRTGIKYLPTLGKIRVVKRKKMVQFENILFLKFKYLFASFWTLMKKWEGNCTRLDEAPYNFICYICMYFRRERLKCSANFKLFLVLYILYILLYFSVLVNCIS